MQNDLIIVTRSVEVSSKRQYYHVNSVACYQPSQEDADRLILALNEEAEAFLAWLRIERLQDRHSHWAEVLTSDRGKKRLAVMMDGEFLRMTVEEFEHNELGTIQYGSLGIQEQPERYVIGSKT